MSLKPFLINFYKKPRTMIEHLAKQIFNDINGLLSNDSSTNNTGASPIKAILEARLKSLNLVTREEFDAQSAVLKRTRDKLQALEDKLAALENT